MPERSKQMKMDSEKNKSVEFPYHGISCQQCQKCVHAAAVRVERSSTHYRCGRNGGANFGKWSWLGETTTCPDFAKIVDDERKAKMNLAWELSADRKMQLYSPRTASSHIVEVNHCALHFNRPFKDIGV